MQDKVTAGEQFPDDKSAGADVGENHTAGEAGRVDIGRKRQESGAETQLGIDTDAGQDKDLGSGQAGVVNGYGTSLWTN